MLLRWCKIALLASNVLFLALVVFNNVTDYPANLAYVEAVLSMEPTRTVIVDGEEVTTGTMLPWYNEERNGWRALREPWIHVAFYWTIILWELAACVLIALGALKLLGKLRAPAPEFNTAKALALAGLTLSLLQWYVAFISVGGEWFLMWQNTMNGQDAAFRMFGMMGICLIFIAQRDEDPPPVKIPGSENPGPA